MTQYSWPWSTVAAAGDGAAELNETLSRSFLATYFAVQNPAVEGVSKGVLGELAVSGTASPLTVQAGSGVCYGLYINDASVTLAVTTPAVGTTGGRVVMQTNWAGTGGGLEASTRLVAKKNTDGVATIPALVQSVGTTWEISLATFTITTGGVIAVTDARTFRKSTMTTDSGELYVDSVTNAILRNSTGLSVIGRAANSTGNPADIVGTDGQVLRVSGATLGFGTLVAAAYAALSVVTAAIADLAVTTAKMALNSVDDTIVGDRVPQFYRRQGGSASDWSTPGTTTYTPTAVRVQAGIGTADGEGTLVVTFPVAFSNKPIVVASVVGLGYAGVSIIVKMNSSTQATLYTGTVEAVVSWLAIGPE